MICLILANFPESHTGLVRVGPLDGPWLNRPRSGAKALMRVYTVCLAEKGKRGRINWVATLKEPRHESLGLFRSERKATLFRPDQFHIKTGLVKYGLLAGAVRLTDEFEIGR